MPPRITSFNSATGAIAGTFTNGGWTPAAPPQTVGTLRTCSISGGVPVIEHYNASLDRYFITSLPEEQANLDNGRTPTSWTRTGYWFKTFLSAPPGTSPVCRFCIPPGLGDSHFFGRGIDECSATGQHHPTFVLEDPAFMHVYLPIAGVCPAGTTPVYRAFDGRPDANHRYMTDRAIRDQMVGRGWIAEGDGPDLVVMCSPT